MFAKVGKEVELEVACVDLKVIKNIRLLIDEASIDEEIYGYVMFMLIFSFFNLFNFSCLIFLV
jgi:hypothetical protein